MGYLIETERFEKAVFAQEDLDMVGLKLCELGNQRFQDRKERGAIKRVYSSRGVLHLSVDLNGRDGALVLDLEKRLPDRLVKLFDVVTDYGTAEHVNGQHAVFYNVHRLCRCGGLILHVLPLVGHWEGHCRYRYDEAVMRRISEICGYDVLHLEIIGKSPECQVAVAYLKKNDVFPDRDAFDAAGVVDSGDLTMTGDYTVRRGK